MSSPSSSSSSPLRDDCLKGKVAIITGGGSGIGYEITHQLLLHGCGGVVICGRREEFLQKACASLNNHNNNNNNDNGMTTDSSSLRSSKGICLYHKCDVRNPEDCTAVVRYTLRRLHRLDIVVNGAAGNFLAEASTLKPKGFKTVLEIDTLGTFNMCVAAYPAFLETAAGTSRGNGKKERGGVIVNISATLHYGATHYQCHASAAKSAIDSLTRSLALEWGRDGIRVVGVAPGPIRDTPGTTKLAPVGLLHGENDDEKNTSSSSTSSTKDSITDMIKEGIPLGRMGQAAEIGMAVAFLCTDRGAGYITGDTLVVDGGQWLYRPPIVPREMVSELSRMVEETSRKQTPKSVLTSKL